MSFEMQKNLTNPAYHKSNPQLMFTLGSVLGAISCFSRADYNLPLFAFLAVMWNQDDVSLHFDNGFRTRKIKLDFY